MKKAFPINPSTNMMEVLGHSGYTFDAAIADIIDNSISAKAKNVTIFFDFEKDIPYLYILDDGEGMDGNKLHQSIVPAYRDIDDIREDNDLGRYSLGLKSASKSFCNQLIVCSKTKNTNAHTVELDFEHIKKSKQWEAFDIDNFELSNLIKKSGTLVLWKDLQLKSDIFLDDDTFVYEKLENLEKSLSHIFGKFLISGKLKIFIQNSKSKKKTEIVGWNPFYLIDNKSTKIVFDKSFKIDNNYVSIKAHILPVYSNLTKQDQEYMNGKGLIEQQGFYIYRNDRLIQEGGWLNLKDIKTDQKCNYARIEVEIGTKLDKIFDVNFSKNKITVPDEALSAFIEVAKLARKESKLNFDYIKKPQNKKRVKKNNDIRVWNTYKNSEGLKVILNEEHPLISELLTKLGKKDSKKLINLITKTLPIGIIQSQGAVEEKFDSDDIMFIIEDTYNSLKKRGFSKEEIIKKMINEIEPCKYYIDQIFVFLEKIKED